MTWTLFNQYAAANGPVLRISQAARAAGLSPRTVRERIRREQWWNPFPDVAVLPGMQIDDVARIAAAVCHARGTTGDADRDVAAATRTTALFLLGIRKSRPRPIDVAIPKARWIRPREEFALTRSPLLRPGDVAEVSGVPTLRGASLARDLAAVRTLRQLRAELIDLRHRGHVRLDDVDRLLTEVPRFPGRANLSAVVTELQAIGRTDSVFEFDVRDRLAHDGILLDRGQVLVPVAALPRLSVDLGIHAIRFGIEVDSFEHHHRPEDLAQDAARRNALARAEDDWRVLHLTWRTFLNGWDAFVDDVRAVITRQSMRLLGLPWPRPEDLRR